jgi:hypothetical protein
MKNASLLRARRRCETDPPVPSGYLDVGSEQRELWYIMQFAVVNIENIFGR